jgi:hypothetical protein
MDHLWAHVGDWLTLMLGAFYAVTALGVFARGKRLTRPGVAFYLAGGIALTALSLLGLMGSLSPDMALASLAAFVGISLMVEATGRLYAPPADRAGWFYVMCGVIMMLVAAAHGLAAYRY